MQNMYSLAAKHLMLFAFKPHLAALVFIAAGSISQALGQAGGTINAFALIGAFAGLVFAGWAAKMGRTEMIKYGLLGSALCGLAWAIASAMFAAGGQSSGEEIQRKKGLEWRRSSPVNHRS
jgi:hypothetical protein